MFYQNILRPLLFHFSAKDPEVVHEKALAFLHWIGKHRWLLWIVAKLATVNDSRLRQDILGMTFRNPLGLAAGFDKNGIALRGLAALGFGFLEMGTVTPLPQGGKPRPRMFRFLEDGALINRMGFNNWGAVMVRKKLYLGCQKVPVPIGINFGKGMETPLETAVEDYRSLSITFYKYGAYCVVNVSSPNTPGIRKLQDKGQLSTIIAAVKEVMEDKPVFVKVAPDLEWEALDDVIEVCLDHKVQGIIATNTTISRAELTVQTEEAGGLSGRPLTYRTREIIRYLRQRVPEDFILIAVGGIWDARDAYLLLKAGANLLQRYTGFIYQGPFSNKQLNRGLLRLLKQDGLGHISETRRFWPQRTT